METFCLCFKLKVGCIVFAFVYLVFQLKDFHDCIKIYKYLGPEENEDEENKMQKEEAKTRAYDYTTKAVIAGLLAAVAVVIFGAAFSDKSRILKVVSVIVAFSAFTPFILSALDDYPSEAYTLDVVYLVICLYGSCLLCSRADEIEEPVIPQVYVGGLYYFPSSS
uniref:Uncharacterized protein n=1 Tax=Graphocephala atropunctata TaxID=36148 RepID=A0A1B6LJU2_9HEMI